MAATVRTHRSTSTGSMNFYSEALKIRFEAAECYLASLDRLLAGETNWDELASDYLDRKVGFESGLALIFPKFYTERDIPQEDICGGRSFCFSAVHGTRCNSILLWNYGCVSRESLHIDHLFPYSLGGPTDARNASYLCSRHNMSKSSDIHIYPWENGEPEWLRPLVVKIREKIRFYTNAYGS